MHPLCKPLHRPLSHLDLPSAFISALVHRGGWFLDSRRCIPKSVSVILQLWHWPATLTAPRGPRWARRAEYSASNPPPPPPPRACRLASVGGHGFCYCQRLLILPPATAAADRCRCQCCQCCQSLPALSGGRRSVRRTMARLDRGRVEQTGSHSLRPTGRVRPLSAGPAHAASRFDSTRLPVD